MIIIIFFALNDAIAQLRYTHSALNMWGYIPSQSTNYHKYWGKYTIWGKIASSSHAKWNSRNPINAMWQSELVEMSALRGAWFIQDTQHREVNVPHWWYALGSPNQAEPPTERIH